MRVLLTGSEGVLGRYLKQYLSGIGYEVYGFDLKETADFVGDIRNTEALVAVMNIVKPDVVLHFAALTSPIESVYRETEYYDVNVVGTARLVRLLTDKHLLVFASSCAVYGNAYDDLKRPVKPGDEEGFIPLSPYGLSKLMAEKVIRFHAENNGFTAVVLRFGNVYSPYDDKYVFWKLWTKKPFILNDPDAVRDFVSVHDLAVLITKIIEKWRSGEYSKKYAVYNVGYEPMKIGDLVDAFMRITGRPEKIVYGGGLKKGEFKAMVLDITDTRKTFGWEPQMRLVPEGIGWLATVFRTRTGK